MSAFRSVEDQLAVIGRGVERIEPEAELKQKLTRSRETGKPLRVKLGIDPTGADVHLGHTVVLRKLRQFQDLGHTVVLIIGTATARVGDPSGRDETRKALTPESIERNAETYLQQIAKVIDVAKAEVVRNGDWFDRFDFGAMLRLLGQITMQRMLERDDFTKRIKDEKPIYLHECLYPLMQGHDSVEVKADVELGGTEQLFNLMVGRDLQRDAGQEPQVALCMPILRGLDGKAKMGKSLGNYIGIHELPKEQFGKTMSIPDDLMREWYTLLTDRPLEEIDRLLASPLEAKKTLAADVVRWFHGPEATAASRADWDRSSKGQDPDAIDEATVSAGGEVKILDLLVAVGLARSKSEARKKVEEGAVNHGPDRTKVSDWQASVFVSDGLVVRLGRKMIRVRLG
ncbi:MAG TPA: tyrosine--tRNA ligase [Fimbriiglobus sp.]|nr:tyrosine--tRNA ligase [Fimbriiglobus sp.]